MCRPALIRRAIALFVDRYRSGRLKLDELVTRTYPMDEIDSVFADMKAGEVARGVFGIGAT
jgi:Zn-dependent alcohol dehydrogenase